MHTHGARIRAAARADAAALADLLARVFAATYGHAIPPAELARHLDEAYAPDLLGRELRGRRIRYLVAEHDGRLVGCAKLEPSPAPQGVPAGAIELAKLYLDGGYHGRGLGAALLAQVLQAASDMRRAWVWLCVWEHNLRAISFYRKHGFHLLGEMPVVVGSVRFRDLVMVRQSAPGPASPTMHAHDR